MAWDELSNKETSGSESPVIGSGLNRAGTKAWPEGLKPKVRYFVASINNAGDTITVEQILTRSLLNQGDLENLGDIIVLREDHNFTKDGAYQIAIKYIELVSENEVVSKDEDEVV